MLKNTNSCSAAPSTPSRDVVLAVWLLASLFAVVETSAQTTERRRAVRRPPVEAEPRNVVVVADFRNGSLGWTPGFADYSPVSADLRLEAGIRPLPVELGIDGTGMLMAGMNRSDDLFMFLKKRLGPTDGIVPDQPYELLFVITFASRAGEGCLGAGGAPGESVYLKAGATADEPLVVLDPYDDHYRMTVDKGNQSESGPAASVAGNINNGSTDCSDDAPFSSVSLTHRHTSIVTSSGSGELWLLVGTDSAFEGMTTLYYQSISALLVPVVEER